MEYKEMKYIAEHITTPSYIFNNDDFLERISSAKQLVGDEIGICYSIKANPFLLDPLFSNALLFDKFEVCSIGELRICKKCEILPNMILFSGVNKNEIEIDEAYQYGVRTFTVESYNHLKYLNNIGKKYDTKIAILIRISADTQFGMDENDVISIIKNREKYQYIDIVGIHYFTGTLKKSYGVIIREIAFLKDFCLRMRSEYGYDISAVEYGTGLGVDYFREQKSGANSLEEIIKALKELSRITKLTIEMGRYFASKSGYYFTKIVDCKMNNGTNYAIVDGGMNQIHYDGQVRSMKIPLHTHLKMTESERESLMSEKWTICGSICSTEDVICRDVEYEHLQEGDILVFRNCGAYSYMESMSTFLSREMPQIYARLGDGDLHLLRRFIQTERFNCRDNISYEL